MDFKSIIDKVDTIDNSKNYWFVRTDNGNYYQEYYEHNYIGIGWDYITIEDLQNITGSTFDIRQKIAQREGLDIVNNSRDKGKVTSIYNKLKAFKNLKRGDIIVIPSENSQRLAFGFITDNQIFTEVNDSNCSFVKRRQIQWVEEKDIDELDKVFYQVRISRHTISSINSYDVYIDKVVKTLFIKNNYSHYVLDLQTDDDINFNTLLQLINNIRNLTRNLNNDFNLGENLEQNAIKLNLQSRGKIEFKFLNSKSLILLATLLGPMTLNIGLTNVTQLEQQMLGNFKQVHHSEIQEIEDALAELEVDRNKINSIY